MKSLAGAAIKFSLRFPRTILSGAFVLVIVSAAVFLGFDRDFMPAFNEGAIQLNVDLMPGKSLTTSVGLASAVEQRLQDVEGVRAVVRKTGRAELDEHAVPVTTSEFICSLDPKSSRSQEEILRELEAIIDPENIPGTVAFSDQPLQHLINHLRSGSRAKIAIKLKGEDLSVLRQRGQRLREAIQDVPGVGNLRIDPIQVDIPQLRIELDRRQLALYGLTPYDVYELIETAMNGRVVTEIVAGQRVFDVLLRMEQTYREDLEALRHLAVQLPGGGMVALESLASIDRDARGPSQIDHEAGVRQIIVQCNPRERASVEVKEDIESRLQPLWGSLTEGNYELSITGLFESEQEAAFWIVSLSALSLVGIFLLLYTMFGSANLSLQVMCALPLALIGAVAAIALTGQDRTIPSLVGLVSLCGIASRNGILLINHYIHLVRHEGETWSCEMLVRAGRERVAPVMMTALTSGLGLVPLTLAAGEPGREILYPIATVIVGGLITSTLMEFLVRPALFWTFGLKAARRIVNRESADTDPDESVDAFEPSMEPDFNPEHA
jgi:HME family heavy-metal exporter